VNKSAIVQALKKNKLTVNAAAKKCKVGYATLYDIVEGKNLNPRFDTAVKIANGLGISINEIIGEVNNEKSCS
jgi:transcriptional regulator with XRE-family HTH domain